METPHNEFVLRLEIPLSSAQVELLCNNNPVPIVISPVLPQEDIDGNSYRSKWERIYQNENY